MQLQIFEWLFRPTVTARSQHDARDTARDRMKSMLTYDRLELPAGRLESLEEELTAVVSRYFDLDRETTHFDLQQYERRASLIANFRLLRSKC